MEKVKIFFTNLFKSLVKKDNKMATIFLAIGILIVINFLSYLIFFRLDLTQNKDYSISQVSKKTVRNLDDLVSVKAYFSSNLPAKYLNLKQEVADILDEYSSYSGGKFKVEFIDPNASEEVKEEITKIGIPTLRFNVLKNDAFEVVQGFMALVVSYGDKKEIIPMVPDTHNLEYNITMIIKKLTSENMPTIGVIVSNLTVDKNGVKGALGKLSEIYGIVDVDLKAEGAIPEEIETLLMIGPKEKFTEDDLKKIDSFLMLGKGLVMLVDGVKVEGGMKVSKNEIGLEALLDNYGLKINKDLVLDTSNGKASFSQGPFTVMINYPLWPKVLPDNFNKENVMVADLQSLMLLWASSLNRTKEIPGFEVYYLARSTPDAFAQKEDYKLNPQENLKTSGESGQYNLAMFATGKLTSAFGQGETENAKIVLVGDSEFITDMFLAQNADNLIFFQNIVDGLTLDEDLIKIRSQGITNRPIKPVEKGLKETMKYANIFGVTILVLIFGLLRYFLRRRSKFVDQL